MSLPHSTWNPLDFCAPISETEYLDLDELKELGSKVGTLCKEEGLPLGNATASILGREVGDDRVDLSRSAEKVACAQVVQEHVIKMVTSLEDTGISRKSFNFCEVTSGIPTDPHMGYDFARRKGDFTHLGFNDSVILRIILDVSKGEEHHSSTPPGKMSMLGSRLSTPRKENRAYWQIASCFQDAMLCTHLASEPKYLPAVMGGTGVTPLFDNPENIYLYVKAYKGGTYSRIYGTATAELVTCLRYLEQGLQTAPVLCPRLREKQEYFWGTYAQYVFIPDKVDLPTEGETRPPEPLYMATGGQNRYEAFQNRLIRTRHVVTRRQAEREWVTTQRLRNIFSGIFESIEEADKMDRDMRSIIKHKYGNALNANSALQNLLRREATAEDARKMMGDKAFRTITDGKRDFERSDAHWIYANGRGEFYSLDDITTSEDIYVREEVSSEETFKVGGIHLRPYTHRGQESRYTKTRVGLYEINAQMEEWSEDLLGRLVTKRENLGRPLNLDEAGEIFDEDPEWVNDDSGLIGRCLRDHRESAGRTYSVILISDDRRLGNQMSQTANLVVLRVPSRSYISMLNRLGKGPQEYPSIEELNPYIDKGKYRPDKIYFDTGSIASSASSLERRDDQPNLLVDRTLHHTGWHEGRRYSEILLKRTQEVFRLKPILHRPIERPRLWRSGSRPASSTYSSHESWRRSEGSNSAGAQ